MSAVDHTLASPPADLADFLHRLAVRQTRPRRSALSKVLLELVRIMLEAREELSDREIASFVSVGCGVFAHESARLHLGRFLRDVQREAA